MSLNTKVNLHRKNFKEKNKIHPSECPSQSPDPDPVELVLSNVHGRYCKNMSEQKQLFKEEWSEITTEHCAAVK